MEFSLRSSGSGTTGEESNELFRERLSMLLIVAFLTTFGTANASVLKGLHSELKVVSKVCATSDGAVKTGVLKIVCVAAVNSAVWVTTIVLQRVVPSG